VSPLPPVDLGGRAVFWCFVLPMKYSRPCA
jgi:hypothetical protein